ncbi:hypothetical protein BDV93DRAFT_30993 [Ceratobasidium sp. AG-I]|nr:hypothetical protein BDV93DRAFT_30993 [Ceratobasidium sp. AG-I]
MSTQVVIVPCFAFAYSSRNSPIGVLDIYFIDWSDTPSLSLVAVLEPPIVAAVPIPPPWYIQIPHHDPLALLS